MRKVLVLGASPKEDRYSNHAVRSLLRHGFEAHAIGNRNGNIEHVSIRTEVYPIENLDSILLYLNAKNQTGYYDYIIKQKPKRIIFNPGTENPELAELARENNILTLGACSLVLLCSGQF